MVLLSNYFRVLFWIKYQRIANAVAGVLLIISVTQCSYSQDFVHHILRTNSGESSESYKSLTFNGAWCWFSDPRAVYYEGKHKRTYAGWVDNFGDILVGYYDHETEKIHSRVIYDNFEIDDHCNPSILFDEEGHLLVFFNRHLGGVQPLFLIKSTEPENIDQWGEVRELHLNDEALQDLGSMNHTYTNPVKLSAENGRIYLFWRGVDGKPCFSFSDDNGDSWSKGRILFMPERIYSFRRPYLKVYSDRIKRIHFSLTDGHPRRESQNNIYYMYYESGKFYKADGTQIADMESLPIQPGKADLVYDAATGEARAWNWDISQDMNGNPAIAYVLFPNDSTHVYCYAYWDKNHWVNQNLINSGGWFPETLEGNTEPEPNYSGGMNIDCESPHTLYLSVKRDSIFEIEKWSMLSSGEGWAVERITNQSNKNNVRPFAIRGAESGNPLQVLWMQNTRYHFYAYLPKPGQKGGNFEDRLHASIKMNIPSPGIIEPLDRKEIVRIMRKTADWQLANPYYGVDHRDWHYATFYLGLKALVELTGEERYRNEMLNNGQSSDWKLMDDVFLADRLAIIDNWVWLFNEEKNPVMIENAMEALNRHLDRDYINETNVRHVNNPDYLKWWSWCDALFMAPPSFVQMWKITGKEQYLKYMDTQWWKTSDYLYSKEDSLYFRDDNYFDKRSENGQEVFWARGNGWVIAGLARILSLLPQDYPNRRKFEQQYREMAHKLLSIQSEDGLWRVSLLDPQYFDVGETSGSAFFTFALAWGLNNKMIDEKYKPKVEKAWIALCSRIDKEGRLGYVQKVAAEPHPFREEDWQVYATGVFLMAGKEMHGLAGKD